MIVPLLLLFALVAAQPVQHSDTVTVTVKEEKVSTPIPTNFAGHSLEVPDCPAMLGRHPQSPRKSFMNLLNNIREKSGEEWPTIRIGGNSADESWYNPDGKPNPKNVHYSITEADFKSYTAFSDQTFDSTNSKYRLRFIGDTDMNIAYNASLTVDYLLGLEKFLNGGKDWKKYFIGFEIGNEPDLFAGKFRPHDWDFKDYMKDTETYLKGIYSSVKTFPMGFMEGATWCCKHNWQDATSINTFTSAYKQYSVNFCEHKYPQNHCHGHPTSIDDLLADKSSTDYYKDFKTWAESTNGLELVLGESNSVACGGEDGVSNVMAAALWGVDWMFNLAAAGGKRINFHGGPSGWYAPITYKNAKDPNDTPQVHPIYYAMVAFSEAVANKSSVNKLESTTTNELIKTWGVAVPLPGGKTAYRVVVIHKDPKAVGSVKVVINSPLPDGTSDGTALVARLTAPSVDSKDGLSWAGQTWDGSKDGLPMGNRRLDHVKHEHNAWTFYVNKGDAALVYLPTVPAGEHMHNHQRHHRFHDHEWRRDGGDDQHDEHRGQHRHRRDH